MGEIALLALLAAGLWLAIDSLRARERAVEAGRRACERYRLQFLDDTVAFARLGLARDEEGRLKLARVYTFEFTESGDSRRQGAISMLGGSVRDVQLEPYRVQ